MRDSSSNTVQCLSPTGNNNSYTNKNYDLHFIENILDKLKIGLYRTSIDGKILYSNHTLLKLLGFASLEDLQQQRFENEGYVFGTSRKSFKKIMEEKGEVIGLESCWKRKDGSDMFVRENSGAIRNDDGDILFFEGLVEDITERKKVEKALKSQTEFSNKLIYHSPVFFVAINAQGKTIMMNETMLSATGYKKIEVIDKNYLEMFVPERDREMLSKVFEHIVNDRENTLNENHILTKDKRELLVEWHGTPIFKDDGDFDFFIGLGINITERKNAEEALRKNEERYKSLFNNATVGIYQSTPEGKLLMANPALMTIYGYSSFEELSGISTSEVYFNPAERDRFKKIIDSEGTVYAYETKGKKADGSEFYFLDSARAITDTSGKVIYYEGIIQDITDKKIAQDSLIQSERNFRKLIEQAPSGIFRTDSNGKFILANSKTCELLGYKEEEILQLNITDTYSTSEESKNELERLHTIKIGEKISFVRPIVRKDKKILTVEVFATQLEDGTFQQIIHDITERKRIEFLQNAVYRISEASDDAKSLNDLYKSVHEIIDSVLPAKNFFIALYNEEKDLLTFPYFVDEIDAPPGPIKAGRGYTAYVLRTRRSVFYTEKLDKKLKERDEVETVGTDSPSWIGVPLVVNNKSIGAMVTQHYSDPNAYDESDLHLLEYVSSQIAKAIVTKRAEEELLKLSSAVKQSSASIIITDLDGKIEYVNPKFSELTGFTPDEVYGKKTNIFKSGETPTKVYTDLWETITNGSEWKGEFRNRKKNGELYWESASISPIKNGEGETTHFLAVKEDITERKRIQKELIVSKEKAEEMNRLKSIFLANMSHELRTPLVGILGYAEILQGDSLNDEQKDMVGTILSSGKRLMNTLNAILELTKLDAEKSELKLSPVILKFVIQEIAELFKTEAVRKDVEINCRIDDENAVSLLDENLLREAIEHLASNAVKYTEIGKVDLILKTDQSSNLSIIEISDTGIGISEENQKVIFEEFRQVSEGLNRQYEGTGLGLTLTKRFIELMHGSIALESELGKGSKFTVTFPLVKSSPQNGSSITI